MSIAVWIDRSSTKGASVAEAALETAARLWYLTAVVGQLVFVFAVASFYGRTAGRGNFEAWNRFIPHGYVRGEALGNVAVASHLGAAVFVLLSGAIQLLPQLRRRAPALHRWNGRLYLLSAFVVSGAGLYLAWARSTIAIAQKLGSSLDAVLVMACAVMALHAAIARDFQAHRRWALRLFLVVSGVWFMRISLALSFLLNKGPFGFDPRTLEGPFLTFLSFAGYLVPLAVLELYLRAQRGPSAPARLAMAAGLLALTVAMGVGIFAATMMLWAPRIKAAADSRPSIGQALSATIASEGIDAAVGQYHRLKAASPATWNLDEGELNRLGYRLLRDHHAKDAIRIFQLNVEAYPRSSNVYDSLGEAYLEDGDAPQAIASYRRSLDLDAHNRGAVLALQKLGAR